jgi:hypothetical protein
MTTRSMLNALTNAIVNDNLDVQTARSLLLSAYYSEQQELQQQVELASTAAMAAKSLGISKATLYRRLAKRAGA